MITNRISRRPISHLIRVRPPLIKRTIPRETSLTRTIPRPLPVRNGIDAHSNIAITALHDGQIVRRPFLSGILAVAELEEGLRFPLSADAPFGVAGEAHAEVFERRGERRVLLGREVGGFAALEHLEVAGDLVEGELFGERAVVVEVDVEGVAGVAGGEERGVDGCCCCRRGEQRGQDPACGVHCLL